MTTIKRRACAAAAVSKNAAETFSENDKEDGTEDAVPSGQRRLGVFLAVLSFLIWGCFPLYFYLLRDVNPLVTLAFRALFTFPLVVPLLIFRDKWKYLREIFRSPKLIGVFCLTTVLIGANWGFFIWLVARNLAVMASLASFITPLLSVLLGVILLRERPAPGTWPAVTLAALAVLGFGAGLGRFPWEAVVSSLFFSSYSLIRKVANVDSTAALCAETVLFAPAALGFLVWGTFRFPGVAESLSDLPTFALLVGAGILTAIPLLLFGSATKRINLSTVGMLQYICPLLQFLCATAILREKMSALQWWSFGVLWAALLWFTVAGLRRAEVRFHSHHQP